MTTQDTPQGHAVFADRLVGELAMSIPGATRVLRKYRVNFCCNGNTPLAEAAAKRGADIDAITRDLAELELDSVALPAADDVNGLISFILSRYHETHRHELPELILLARKVEAVHGDHPDAPHGLADILYEMAQDLDAHMCKEEMILFPAMQEKVMTLEGPIAQMRHEHSDHGEHLHRIEAATHNFALPDGACGSWRALYLGTSKLVEDLVAHIHLENNVLFPRFEA
ncbi:MAG: iron-sulfur cluster repair protein YtfE [Pseudomonadota bacterium]